jgi:ribosomal protein S18 acetylase RimI-like enzyme
MNVHANIIAEGYRIADARLLDLIAVWRLERACFPQDAYDPLTLLSMALSHNLVRLKVEADDRLVGYAAGELREWERVGWIVTIGVLPAYWGRGIGGRLLTSTEDAMRPFVDRVKLTARQSNIRAISLYERNGYAHAGALRRYYHDGEDGLVMEKKL